MIPPIARRLSLESRISHLAWLAVEPAGVSHRDQVARACAALNCAALIASDLGTTQSAVRSAG